jgi:hypothetical protein
MQYRRVLLALCLNTHKNLNSAFFWKIFDQSTKILICYMLFVILDVTDWSEKNRSHYSPFNLS